MRNNSCYKLPVFYSCSMSFKKASVEAKTKKRLTVHFTKRLTNRFQSSFEFLEVCYELEFHVQKSVELGRRRFNCLKAGAVIVIIPVLVFILRLWQTRWIGWLGYICFLFFQLPHSLCKWTYQRCWQWFVSVVLALILFVMALFLLCRLAGLYGLSCYKQNITVL